MSETGTERCRRYRRRLLDVSQRCKALHLAGAFSCMEIVDTIYHDLYKVGDTVIMSKGHGWLAQAVILEDLEIWPPGYLGHYGTQDAPIGVHPDPGVPGVACATGSLGHGLLMGIGIALADRECSVYVVLSDGELQEGSTWEGILQAGSMQLDNLLVFVDNNDLQSLGRTSETHPSLYSIHTKFDSFKWMVRSWKQQDRPNPVRLPQLAGRPLAVICETTKGWPISFMKDKPIWHYRSPTPEEYQQALEELA